MSRHKGTCSRRRCGYVVKCRGLCKKHYLSFLQQRVDAGEWITGWVPSDVVAEHIRKLRAAGLGCVRLSELTGVSKRRIQLVGTHPWVFATTSTKLLAIPVPDIPHTVAAGGAKLPPTGTVRRLRALVAIGHTNKTLAQVGGFNDKHLWQIISGSQKIVTADVARRADALFRRLSMTPGGDTKAYRRAARNGWAPPFAWECDCTEACDCPSRIDDPNAEPNYGPRTRATFEERYLELRELGYRDRQIADRMGISLAAVERGCWRNDIQPMGRAS